MALIIRLPSLMINNILRASISICRYKGLCGVDFSKDFVYADMTTCYDKWRVLTHELAKKARGIDSNDSLRCRNAWSDLKEEIDRTDFFDEAARGALNLNPRILEKYSDVT